MRRMLLLSGVVAIASCRITPAPPPVPIEGNEEEVTAFAGEWSGRYWSKATKRHGTIKFTLPEKADTGYGEVEITFSPALELAREAAAADYRRDHPNELLPSPCTVIGITVVRIEDGRVRGTMDPYWDPDCDCRAHTVFEGKLARNRITGTFSIRREAADRRILTGQWQVDREG